MQKNSQELNWHSELPTKLEPEIWPHLVGSAPFCMFNRAPLNLSFVMRGIGHGDRAHAPNEYLVVAEGGPTGGLSTLEQSYVAILDEFAQI